MGEFSLRGRVALVTGGATGIGLECARQLSKLGSQVVICGRRAQMVDAAVLALPGVCGISCDLGTERGISKLLSFVNSQHLKIDLLINNAGIQVQTDLTADDDAVLESLEMEMRINLMGPIRLTKRLLPTLIAQPDAAIVNMLSLLAVMPKHNAPGYCASKAGLHAFSKSLAALLRGSKVRVAVVFPPLVDTPMTRGRGSDKMPVDVFVREMLRQLAAGREEISVGQAKTLLALNRIAPGFALWWTRRISAGTTISEHFYAKKEG